MYYIGISHDEYLEHHGTKGMKWGVRKRRTTLGGRRAQRKQFREIDRRRSEYEREFDSSSTAKKLQSEASKAYDRYKKSYNTNTGEYGKKERDALNKADSDYEAARRKHITDRAIQEFSKETVSEYQKKRKQYGI